MKKIAYLFKTALNYSFITQDPGKPNNIFVAKSNLSLLHTSFLLRPIN